MVNNSAMSDTLLLNTSGQPISQFPVSVIDWRRAVKLYFQGRITVLNWYDDWEVSSPTTTMKVPATIMTKKYHHIKKPVRFSRFNVHLRDEFKCQYCGDEHTFKELTMDHVKPRSAGGTTCWMNIVSACKDCNRDKGSELWRPMREPYEPNIYQLAALRSRFPFQVKHQSWLDYIPNGEYRESISVRV